MMIAAPAIAPRAAINQGYIVMNTQKRPDPKLLDILVCPVTKSTLEYDAQANELISKQAGLAFPIRDGLPIMLIDEARKL